MDSIIEEMRLFFQSIIERTDLSALEKLEMMLSSQQKQSITAPDVMEALHQPEYRELQEQLNIQTIHVIAPLIAQVIHLANKEQVLHAKTPLETAQFLLAGNAFILESGLFQWSNEKQNALRGALKTLLEQALGAKEGAFNFITNPQ